MNGFNHLASLAGDLVEITSEKDDGPVEEILKETEEISDYNIGERTNRALFLKFIDNIVKDDLENSLKRDIISAIAFGIEEENEEHLIQSWTYFTTQDREKASVRKCLLEYLPYF